ncbi:PEP-CTERM sorting domain-containing protein [Gemmatimonas sp.]|uniref:PEP-CTERM sorting domain-containing protein n=1 Tax=Gemmatimonas sp. TaxID=1962908 RepID=UPI003982EC83
MARTFRSIRRLAIVVASSLASQLLPMNSAMAQASTVNFNALTESTAGSGTRFLSNCYMENGFVFTAVGIPCTGAAAQEAFIAGNANSPTFSGMSGTFGITLNSATASFIDITRSNGTAFTPLSIMLAPFDFAGTMVTFTGVAMGGGSVTQAMTSLLASSGFQTVTFGSQFANVTSLRIGSGNEFQEPYVRIDNFNVVPEPATVVLLAAGLAGLVAVRFRRRNVV